MPGHLSPNNVVRGSVILVPFPNSDLRTAKLRPAIVIQSDEIDSDLAQIIIAMVSSNLSRLGRKARFLIETDTESRKSSGLLFDSVVMADNLATVIWSQVVRSIGVIEDMSGIDRSLRHSLSL